jgi:hypothetical protein
LFLSTTGGKDEAKNESSFMCAKGKVYAQKIPAYIVRLSGRSPIGATVHEVERLRCNLCLEVFTAAPPNGVGTKKYD